MLQTKHLKVCATLALELGLIIASIPALAAPISMPPRTPDAEVPVRKPIGDVDLVLTAPQIDAAPDFAAFESATNARQGRGPLFPGRAPGVPGEWGGFSTTDLGAGLGGMAMRETLRDYINVQRAATGTDPTGSDRRGGTRGETSGLGGIDLGPAANEWVQETVRDIIGSALRLDINERGQTSFSVLGLGEFSISVSGDRSEVALSSGDTVLMTAQRTPEPAASGSGPNQGGAVRTSDGTSVAVGSSMSGDSPIRQAFELALELAIHPLSFLVYGLIATYALLWTVLSHRSLRRARQPLRSAVARPPASRSVPELPLRKRASRGRKRRHRSRASTQRS